MKIRRKAERLEAALNSVSDRKRDLQESFVFHQFDNPPELGINGDMEVALIYNGDTMPLDVAIDYMENVGYITPDNFDEQWD